MIIDQLENMEEALEGFDTSATTFIMVGMADEETIGVRYKGPIDELREMLELLLKTMSDDGIKMAILQ